jgi:hypothetical protein
MLHPKFITAIILPLLVVGIFCESANARRTPIPDRRPLWMGGQGSRCPSDFAKPPVCDIPDGNYKASNGPNGKHLFKGICDQIKSQLTKTPKCILVVGYRSCKFNSNTRGAARNSRHLCGKAADLRNGTCGALGATHLAGTAKHQHLSPFGTCK